MSSSVETLEFTLFQIGLHFAQKSIVLDDNKLVKLQLWDIAGTWRFVPATYF